MVAIRSNGVFGSSGAPDSSRQKQRDDGRASGHRARKASSAPREKKLDANQCKAKMLQLLAARDYSVKTMEERLSRAGFAPDDIRSAVKMAVDTRLLDDMRYAELYISSRRELGWGRSRIERELRKQGIDCTQIPGYPDSFFTVESELERARELLRGHRTSAKDVRASHYRYLASKGFDHATCMRALSDEGF
ncbi:MAG: regulatory protein RecX [Coriobacteriales bacterium]|jgi:SOS response regulatory protein OraA/RecX